MQCTVANQQLDGSGVRNLQLDPSSVTQRVAFALADAVADPQWYAIVECHVVGHAVTIAVAQRHAH